MREKIEPIQIPSEQQRKMDISDIETTVDSFFFKYVTKMQELCVVQRRLVLFSIPKLAAVLYTFWGIVRWQSLNTSSGGKD